MKDIFKKQEKKGINSVIAVATGVAVGVGVAVAASEALKDKKTRKKVDDFVTDVKDRAMEAKEKAAEYFDSTKEKPKVKKTVKKVKKVQKTKKVKK